MITFTFYSVAERKPEHGQYICYLKKSLSFDDICFEPRICQVDYLWAGLDEDGLENGHCCTYCPGDEQMEGYKLIMCVDGQELSPNDYWCPEEEMSKNLPED